MNPNPAKPILACDVGGTHIKLGVAHDTRLLARMELDAEPQKGLSAALHRIAGKIPMLCRQAGVRSNSLAGFGLSFPGVIQPGTEKILSTPAGKFDDAKNLNVPKLAAKLLSLPTRICNDANAALMGEYKMGAARNCQNVVLMTLGTGIGASAIIDGVPLRGRNGQAGCLGGHLTLNLNGRICNCGNLGCAESEGSTWALSLQARAHPHFSRSQLARGKILDYAAVFRAAANADPLAMELRDHSLRVWAAALVNLIHAYDPEMAIIGGGIMRSGKIILPALRRYVAKHAWVSKGRVIIKPALLGNDAGMLGVSTLFWEEK